MAAQWGRRSWPLCEGCRIRVPALPCPCRPQPIRLAAPPLRAASGKPPPQLSPSPCGQDEATLSSRPVERISIGFIQGTGRHACYTSHCWVHSLDYDAAWVATFQCLQLCCAARWWRCLHWPAGVTDPSPEHPEPPSAPTSHPTACTAFQQPCPFWHWKMHTLSKHLRHVLCRREGIICQSCAYIGKGMNPGKIERVSTLYGWVPCMVHQCKTNSKASPVSLPGCFCCTFGWAKSHSHCASGPCLGQSGAHSHHLSSHWQHLLRCSGHCSLRSLKSCFCALRTLQWAKQRSACWCQAHEGRISLHAASAWNCRC